jgi:hypothetical protein
MVAGGRMVLFRESRRRALKNYEMNLVASGISGCRDGIDPYIRFETVSLDLRHGNRPNLAR